MKKIKIIALAFLAFTSFSTFAQEEKTDGKSGKGGNFKERAEKIDKLKIAFITTELNLTTAEAEKFWPLYNEQETKLKELRKSGRTSAKDMQENFEKMSDADAKKQMETMFDNEAKETALRKEYSDKFSTLLGAKRALKLMHLEHEFRRELLERLKDQHHPGPRGPHAPRNSGDKK